MALLFPGLCLVLVQCASTDPQFESLAAQASGNHSEDAIVGMWHKRQFIVEWVEKPRCSLLFNHDGTGVYRLASGTEVLGQNHVQWHQESNGSWSLRWLDRGEFTPSGKVTLRLTRDRNTLLWSSPGLNWVFERVE